jgi:hypothetical protein
MTGKWAVGLAIGLLFAGVVIAVVVVSGHYPRTGDSRAMIYAVVLLAAPVAVVGAARVFPALSAEPPASRLASTVFVGFLFGGLAIGVLFIIALVAFAIVLSRTHSIGVVGY